MRLRRGPLFWGLLLIPLGGIPLLVRGGYLDASAFADVGRLWPLLLVGLGLAILLGRGRAGLAITVILALVLGVAGGAALASGGSWLGAFGSCVGTPPATDHLTNGGALDPPGKVDLRLDCGEATIGPATANAWTLGADYRGNPPIVTASGSSLRIASPDLPGDHYQHWAVGLPTASTRELDLTANAAKASLDLAGMTLDRLDAEVNAADLRIDGGHAATARVDISINAGRARVTLGQGPTQGRLAANAGAMDLCVPDGATLVLHMTDQLTFVHNLGGRGLARDGNTWTRTGASAGVIELTIDGNAASFTLDPDGGC
jgi:hypothetical protein